MANNKSILNLSSIQYQELENFLNAQGLDIDQLSEDQLNTILTNIGIDPDVMQKDNLMAELWTPKSAMGQKIENYSWSMPGQKSQVEVNRDNILMAGNLYYIYQHDRLRVFDIMEILYKDYFHGQVKLSNELVGFDMYRYHKKKTMRYDTRARWMLYKRIFGYGPKKLPAKAPVNINFHKLFVNFNQNIAKFFRDKRISNVIRPSAVEPGFGSIEKVRKSGEDLRNSLSRNSYGVTPWFTDELFTYLNDCMESLRDQELHGAYGVKDEWQLIEKISDEKLNVHEQPSIRLALADTGSRIIKWLASDNIKEADQNTFEQNIIPVGKWAEQWIVSQNAATSIKTIKSRTKL